ncbi:hypothetical protein J6590_058398 [Homalodisca vitripennis]|nr:hypothetical protein J6590_058398 [Homalodisca vitripennis]
MLNNFEWARAQGGVGSTPSHVPRSVGMSRGASVPGLSIVVIDAAVVQMERKSTELISNGSLSIRATCSVLRVPYGSSRKVHAPMTVRQDDVDAGVGPSQLESCGSCRRQHCYSGISIMYESEQAASTEALGLSAVFDCRMNGARSNSLIFNVVCLLVMLSIRLRRELSELTPDEVSDDLVDRFSSSSTELSGSSCEVVTSLIEELLGMTVSDDVFGAWGSGSKHL